MKTLLTTWLLAVFTLVPAALALPGICAASGDSTMWQPASGWQGSGLFRGDDHGAPATYDPLLLALGRSVYADLQRARQAALNRQSTNLMVALEEADDTIHRLALPPQDMALDAQLQVIRNDLKDRSKDLDQELWEPVGAEIDDVLVYAPDDIKKQTYEAVSQARAAAGKGDRAQAASQLDVIMASLHYSLGIFPLHDVKLDIESARASAAFSQPDWAGALEAVQSALATFHWYTRDSARGYLTAYDDVINAYILATEPEFRSGQQYLVIRYLERARHRLESVPGGKQLATAAGRLIGMGTPLGSDIKPLLDRIQSEISRQRHAAEGRFWDSIGRDKAG